MKKFMPLVAVLVNKVSPKLRFKLQYFHHRKKFPNLDNPKDFSEIIGSEMVFRKVDAYSDLADKVKVREYLSKLGLTKYLPQIYGIWENAEDIDVSNCPNSFILKVNHGSGGHVICRDKDTFDSKSYVAHFHQMLSTKYSSLETHYNTIKPLVFAEEFISDGHAMPTDYKFMCLDGEIKAILLCFDRDSDVHKLVYSENWEKLDYIKGESFVEMDYPCPENFDEMKSIVKKIASAFTQVRVDLYNAYGKIYIGELTFTADGGILRNFTTDAIQKMGR